MEEFFLSFFHSHILASLGMKNEPEMIIIEFVPTFCFFYFLLSLACYCSSHPISSGSEYFFVLSGDDIDDCKSASLSQTGFDVANYNNLF